MAFFDLAEGFISCSLLRGAFHSIGVWSVY